MSEDGYGITRQAEAGGQVAPIGESMVDRVATAIFRDCAGERAGTLEPDWEDMEEPRRNHWRELARAALEAMREPTEAMLDAGRTHGPVVLMERDVGKPWPRCLTAEEVLAVHQAMIDAALSPLPEPPK